MGRLRPAPVRFTQRSLDDTMREIREVTGPGRSAPLATVTSQEMLRKALLQLEACDKELAWRQRRLKKLETTLNAVRAAVEETLRDRTA